MIYYLPSFVLSSLRYNYDINHTASVYASDQQLVRVSWQTIDRIILQAYNLAQL